MITGELKSKVNRVWDSFWSGGISNNINATEMRAISIAQPPRDLQARFAGRTAEVRERRPTVQRALAAGGELFASLQSRAFRGTL